MASQKQDTFMEQMIKRGTKKSDLIQRLVLVIAALIVLAIPVLLGGNVVYYVEPVLVVIVALLVWIFWRRIAKEYEYIYTEGALDIDVVYSAVTRRHLVSFDCRKVRLIAPALDEKVKAQIEQRKSAVKIMAIPGQIDEDTYVILGEYHGKQYNVFFAPNQEIRRSMHHYAPRTTIVK